jgi:hypothetical protein
MANKFQIVEPEEAEIADAMICIAITDPLIFPDNEIASCADCGKLLQHRPNAPKKPKKVCISCISPLLEEEAKNGNLTTMFTQKTLSEVIDYVNRKEPD